MTAIIIFTHIWNNYAIKHGRFTEDNVENEIKVIREAIKKCYGIDTIQLAQRVLETRKNKSNK